MNVNFNGGNGDIVSFVSTSNGERGGYKINTGGANIGFLGVTVGEGGGSLIGSNSFSGVITCNNGSPDGFIGNIGGEIINTNGFSETEELTDNINRVHIPSGLYSAP